MSEKKVYQKIDENMRSNLKARSLYFNKHSQFNDCPSCNYNCCESDLPVGITLIDIVSIALVSSSTIEEVYESSVKINAVNAGGNVFTWRIGLGLKKPCNYYKEKKCSIYADKNSGRYAGRPVSCAYFPESFQLTIRKNEREAFSHDYPCVKTPTNNKREECLDDLGYISLIEDIVNNIVLFEKSPYIINIFEDISNMGFSKNEINNLKKINLTHTKDHTVDRIDLPGIAEGLVTESGIDKYKDLMSEIRRKVKVVSNKPQEFLEMFYSYFGVLEKKLRESPEFMKKKEFTLSDVSDRF